MDLLLLLKQVRGTCFCCGGGENLKEGMMVDIPIGISLFVFSRGGWTESPSSPQPPNCRPFASGSSKTNLLVAAVCVKS